MIIHHTAHTVFFVGLVRNEVMSRPWIQRIPLSPLLPLLRIGGARVSTAFRSATDHSDRAQCSAKSHTIPTPLAISGRIADATTRSRQQKTSEPQREPATPRLTTSRAAARRLLDAPAPMREKKPIDAEMVLCRVSVIQQASRRSR